MINQYEIHFVGLLIKLPNITPSLIVSPDIIINVLTDPPHVCELINLYKFLLLIMYPEFFFDL